jgi:DNA-directed RNA polymerase specialized sigma24 family protein
MARAETKENAWSFDQIYDEYKTPIYNYVYHLVGDREQADDLTQDTFEGVSGAAKNGCELKAIGLAVSHCYEYSL